MQYFEAMMLFGVSIDYPRLYRAFRVALRGLAKCNCAAIIFRTKKGDHAEDCPRNLRERVIAELLKEPPR